MIRLISKFPEGHEGTHSKAHCLGTFWDPSHPNFRRLSCYSSEWWIQVWLLILTPKTVNSGLPAKTINQSHKSVIWIYNKFHLPVIIALKLLILHHAFYNIMPSQIGRKMWDKLAARCCQIKKNSLKMSMELHGKAEKHSIFKC